MKKFSTTSLLLAFCFLANALYAQATGKLIGKVMDESANEPLMFATLTLLKNGVEIRTGSSDMDGNYEFAAVAVGDYELICSYVGLPTIQIKGVKIESGRVHEYDIKYPKDAAQQTVITVEMERPMVQVDNTANAKTLTSEDIKRQGTRAIGDLAAQKRGVVQKDAGEATNSTGSRSASNDTYVDGMRVFGRNSIPETNINGASNENIATTRKEIRRAKELAKEKAKVAAQNPKTPLTKAEEFQKGKKSQEVPDLDIKAEKIAEAPPVDPQSPPTYGSFIENTYQDAGKYPTSTFSIDVDRASYTQARNSIVSAHVLPLPQTVRVEEMINYFEYNYPAPKSGHPYDLHAELSDCPWNPKAKLLMLGLQAEKMVVENAPQNNLVFLIDVSGSMGSSLALVKESLKLLIDNLRPIDNISLVVYAGAAGLVLPPTSGGNKPLLYAALDMLNAGGSTAGGEGILLAYKTAKEHYQKNGNNRVILCTDGDFNVGASSEAELEKLIEQERKSGVFLTVLGFGMGNYQDAKMETLADKGNGNYSYIDDIEEAKKSLIKEMGGTLHTVAKDVKLQLDFNEKAVKSYRLVGYENRLLAEKDFNDDTKDAGEMGAGHTVTAFYEVVMLPNADPAAELVKIKTRYKLPTASKSTLFDMPVLANIYQASAQSSENFRFAASVAGFGMCLRESQFIDKSFDLKKVLSLAKTATQTDPEGYKAGFVALLEDALKLAKIHK